MLKQFIKTGIMLASLVCLAPQEEVNQSDNTPNLVSSMIIYRLDSQDCAKCSATDMRMLRDILPAGIDMGNLSVIDRSQAFQELGKMTFEEAANQLEANSGKGYVYFFSHPAEKRVRPDVQKDILTQAILGDITKSQYVQ